MQENFLKMKTFICLLVGTIMYLMILGTPKTGLCEWSNGNPYYYSDGKKISLTISLDYISIRLRPSTSLDSNLSEESSSMIDEKGHKRLSKHGLVLLKTKTGINKEDVMDLKSELSSSRSIEQAVPVFEASGALMIATDKFIAQFAPGISQDRIKDLNMSNGVEIVEKLNWQEQTYLLKVVDGNALPTANTYHELEEVIYAHPDFIRIMKKTPQKLNDPNQRLILGPDGQILPSDTEVEKGSLKYRIVEPDSMTLPESLPSEGYNKLSPVSKDTIKTENFESTFPNSWSLSGNPTWGIDDNRKYEGGSYSGYGVGSNYEGPGPYPDDVNAWMIFGPFDLSDADAARVDLQTWIITESGNDHFKIMASTDGTDFYGRKWSGGWALSSGESGWMNIMFDLSQVYTLGNLCGQPQVWVAIVFTSNNEKNDYEGAYVDNVVIEKITDGYEDLTNDDYDHLQWSLNNNGQLWGTPGADIQVSEAWNVTESSEVTIAILDEGVDLTHPDLDLVTGYDATDKSLGGAPEGNDAHGTNCAGIAAAVTNNSQGIAGIAQSAKIMPVRIAYDDGFGDWITNDSWIANGIHWAINNGADILSNSWGGCSPSTTVTNAIKDAKSQGRNGKGAVILFAAGNNNSDVIYPATLSQVLAVGALSPCDERKSPTSCDGEWNWGSNYGPELDIAAPGVYMYCTDIQGIPGESEDDYYYKFNGTSSATAVVAGVAGLILSMDPSLTAVEVENTLTMNADDLGPSGWDQYTGHGRVNAYNSVSNIYEITITPILQLLLLDE